MGMSLIEERDVVTLPGEEAARYEVVESLPGARVRLRSITRRSHYKIVDELYPVLDTVAEARG